MQHFSQNASRVPASARRYAFTASADSAPLRVRTDESKPVYGASDLITEEDIAWYWRIGTIPTALAILVFALGGQTLRDSWMQYAVEGVLFFVLAFLAWKEHASRRDAIALNVQFGILLGLAVAILGSLQGFSFYQVFSFIASPLLGALLGAVIAILGTLFFRMVPHMPLAFHRRFQA